MFVRTLHRSVKGIDTRGRAIVDGGGDGDGSGGDVADGGRSEEVVRSGIVVQQ